jgi:sugar phosphate isomerase/epimerase
MTVKYPRIGLGHLTVERLQPPEVVTQAAKAGFATTGLRFWDGFTDVETFPLRPGSPMLKETLLRLESTDIVVEEIENIVLSSRTNVENYRSMFEVGTLLGAKRVIIGSVVDDEAHGTDLFAALCDVASEFGLDIAIEFYLKWHGCASLSQGLRIVANAGQSNGKLLVDALHLSRSGGTPDELAKAPRKALASLQLCDAPGEKPANLDAISHESRFARLIPGEGGLPLADVVRAFPDGLPIGIEIPNRVLEDEIGSQAFLCRCYEATARLVEDATQSQVH